MKLYAHKVTVKPVIDTVGFPIDMLRRDGLTPLSQTDSNKIHRYCEMNEPHDMNRTIQLWKRDVKTWKPCTERWKSFLWDIVEHVVM